MKNVEKNVVNVQNSHKKRKVILLSILITVFVFTFLILSSFIGVFSNSEGTDDLLNGNSINSMSLTTFIYDKDGNEIDRIHGLENRIHVSYENMPKSLVDAIVSIEDERFFSHKGIDIKRTAGAAASYIFKGGEVSYGGSTITQQLVKNITNDDETNISRKFREWYRAAMLEGKYSKEYIFETYANTVYFGEGAYGVEVASNTYFNKSVKDLSISESAVLAAAIQSPESTNPYISDEARNKLLKRKDIVLSKMLELNKITAEEYEKAKNENITFVKGNTNQEIKSYFVESAIEQVISDLQKEKNMSYEEAKKKVYTSGYKIYTTLDQSVQNAIDNAYNNDYLFYTDKNGDFMQSAMVVMDNSTGNVVGISGGAGKKEANFVFNRATQSYRQPGSCMKPIGAYGPAFEKGAINTSTILQDVPLTIGSWSPKNYYGYFKGNVTVRQAVAQSMNLPAVRANMKVDVDYAYNFAKGCGLKSLTDDDKNIAPLSLGGLTHGVTPLEMASAYATIANGGDYNEPKFYTKVLDRNDKEVLYKNYMPTRAMQKSTAASLTVCLRDVVTSGTGAGSIWSSNGMAIAGKTGNTNDDKDQWFCGFTPYYTIACWNGYDTPKPIGYRKYGSYPYTSMKLFNTVVNEISKGQAPKDFDTSEALEKVMICNVSHDLATSACYSKGCAEEKNISGKSKPTSYCSIHTYYYYEDNNQNDDSIYNNGSGGYSKNNTNNETDNAYASNNNTDTENIDYTSNDDNQNDWNDDLFENN